MRTVWPRSPKHRTPGFDIAFALSFTAAAIGGGLFALGLATDTGAMLGFGFVLAPVALVACVIFGIKGAVVQNRSILGSLANGYRQIWPRRN